MKIKRIRYLFFLIFAASVLSLAGCASDTVGVHQDPPELSSLDVAHQAGYTGKAFAMIGPYLFEDLSPGKDEYIYMFPPDGDGEGTVYFEFFNAAEADAQYDNADNARMYTMPDESISLNFEVVEKDEISLVLTFDLVADPYDYDTRTATLNGSGTLDTGIYAGDWSLEDVVISATGDPQSGSLSFTIEDMTAVITYDGDDTVTVTIGDDTYTLDLETGNIS